MSGQNDNIAALIEEERNDLRTLVAKIVEPMRRARPDQYADKSDAELINDWSDWYSRIENTILWDVDNPHVADLLTKLYDADMRLDEIRELFEKDLQPAAQKCMKSLDDRGVCRTNKLDVALDRMQTLVNSKPDGVAKELREKCDHLATLRDKFVEEIEAVITQEGVTTIRMREGGGPEDLAGSLALTVARLKHDRDKLFTAIKKHHEQKADDRCFLDDNDLYEAAGLEPADVRVGDKDAMLKNCERFLKNRCQSGGPWKSYSELEAEIASLKEAAANAKFEFVPVPGGFTCSPQAPQVLRSANDNLVTLIRNLLKDVADRYKIFKPNQFSCPHLRALAHAVNWDG